MGCGRGERRCFDSYTVVSFQMANNSTGLGEIAPEMSQIAKKSCPGTELWSTPHKRKNLSKELERVATEVCD